LLFWHVCGCINKEKETMAEDQFLNGVNVTAVSNLINQITEDPEIGQTRWHLKNKWITCGQNQSRIESFYAAKQEIPHKEPFELKADEPAALAGDDTGPNPVEHLLNALGYCLTTTLVYHAAARGIKIDELEAELEGDIDLRGFLGISSEVRRGYQNMKVKFKVKTDEENLDRLRALSKLSPVFDVTSNGTNVTVEIERK
jgi:uncharacterized OsmC-like protein